MLGEKSKNSISNSFRRVNKKQCLHIICMASCLIIFNNILEINILISILLSMIFGAIVTKFFIKSRNDNYLEKVKIGILSLIITCLIIMPLNVKQNYKVTNIQVTANGTSSSNSKGTEVWIKDIIIDGVSQDLNSFLVNEGWENRGQLVSYEMQPATLDFELYGGEKIEIVFLKHPYSGNVNIRSKYKEETVDLYSEIEEEYIYKVELEGTIILPYLIINYIGLLILIYMLTFILISKKNILTDSIPIISNKIWGGCALIVTIISLIGISGLVIATDPFFQYHKPSKDYLPIINNGSYQNPGLAKIMDYKSIITGSSMTQNFRVSWFDEMFNTQTLKVPYTGAHAKDYKTILDIAFNNKEIENVFLGLDIFALVQDPNKNREVLPEYLYDDNLFNDVSYTLNKSVLIDYVLPVLKREPSRDIDDVYVWNDLYQYSKDDVLKVYSRPNKQEMMPSNSLLKVAQENYKVNIQPLIEDNPNTNFKIFFPPYSILYWDYLMQTGELNAYMTNLNYIIQALLEYDNVSLFYYQDIEEIIMDLNNYKDHTHYREEINYFMCETMSKNQYQLTKDNYKEHLEHLYQLVINFDYEKFIEQ